MRTMHAYFRTVSLGNRRSCPTCKMKLGFDEEIWSWGDYQTGMWHTVAYFCQGCYRLTVQQRLLNSGYKVFLKGYRDAPLPKWITL